MAAHDAGMRIHAIEDDIRDQERALRDKERQLEKARKSSAAAQSTILASNDPTTRARPLLDLQSRNAERNTMEREIEGLKHRIERLRQPLDQNRSDLDTKYR